MTTTQTMDRPALAGTRRARTSGKEILPPSSLRVAKHTPDHVLERIRLCTVENIARAISSPERIDSRLRDLDREWDVERVLELNASLLAFSGVVLGRWVDRRWLYLPLAVTGFLAQHALQGWCPPLPIIRRLGVRTSREIEQERNALKMIRGDTGYLPESVDPRRQAEELLSIQER